MDLQELAPGITLVTGFVGDPDQALADVMEQVEFTQRSRKMYGRTFKTPRLEAWHGPSPYAFGGSSLPARPMPPILTSLAIRSEWLLNCEDRPPVHFDLGCLVNLYRDGQDTVSWHSDDEPEMGDPVIASISLGASREFAMRRKSPNTCPVSSVVTGPNRLLVTLTHGSLLVMARGVQSEWEHSLPRRKRCTEPRVNLTYRSAGS